MATAVKTWEHIHVGPGERARDQRACMRTMCPDRFTEVTERPVRDRTQRTVPRLTPTQMSDRYGKTLTVRQLRAIRRRMKTADFDLYQAYREMRRLRQRGINIEEWRMMAAKKDLETIKTALAENRDAGEG